VVSALKCEEALASSTPDARGNQFAEPLVMARVERQAPAQGGTSRSVQKLNKGSGE